MDRSWLHPDRLLPTLNARAASASISEKDVIAQALAAHAQDASRSTPGAGETGAEHSASPAPSAELSTEPGQTIPAPEQ